MSEDSFSDPPRTRVFGVPPEITANRPTIDLSGRFQLIEVGGSGGPGQVLRARDLDLDRPIAIKRVHPRHEGRRDLEYELLREARLTASLQHAAIPAVHAIGRFRDGQPFFALRYLKGEDLHDAIRRFHREMRKPGIDFRSPRFRRLVEALVVAARAAGFAHSKRIVHRDIKPGNIMLGEPGEVLLIDWGLATRFESDRAVAPIRAGGATAEEPERRRQGTVEFSSPEQARGEAPHPTMDVFSLGATLYMMLTNLVPYRDPSESARVLSAQEGRFEHPAVTRPGVPSELAEICMRAMAKSPLGRYPTAAAFASDLQRWLDGEETVASPDRPLRAIARRIRRHPGAFALATAACLAAIGLVAWLRQQALSSIVSAGRTVALAEVDRLLEVGSAGVGDQIDRLRRSAFTDALHREMEARLQSEPLSPSARLRLETVLGRVSTEPAATLANGLVELPAAEAAALHSAVRPRGAELGPLLRDRFRREQADPARRLRAGFWLALLKDGMAHQADFPALVTEALAGTPADESLASAPHLAAELPLLRSAVEAAARREIVSTRRQTLLLLRMELEEQPSRRILVALDAEAEHLPFVRGRVDLTSELALGMFRELIDRHRAAKDTLTLDDFAIRRVANGAALLAASESCDHLPALFEPGPDPRLRTLLARRLAGAGANAKDLVAQLDRVPPNAEIARMYLLLALGEFDAPSPAEPFARVDRLAETWFEFDPSPVVHSAAEWWLRRRGRTELLARLTDRLRRRKPTTESRWYITEFGVTMIRLKSDPAPGSGGTNGCRALASRELSRGERARALAQRQEPARADHPVIVDGHQAAFSLCNEISRRAGLEGAYELLGGPASGAGAGYRLPTDEEWELACRAGCRSPLPFASEISVRRRMIRNFQTVEGEGPGPVGAGWPNEAGFFDMLGGLCELTGSRTAADAGTLSVRTAGWNMKLEAQHPGLRARVSDRAVDLDSCGVRLARTEVPDFR